MVSPLGQCFSSLEVSDGDPGNDWSNAGDDVTKLNNVSSEDLPHLAGFARSAQSELVDEAAVGAAPVLQKHSATLEHELGVSLGENLKHQKEIKVVTWTRKGGLNKHITPLDFVFL